MAAKKKSDKKKNKITTDSSMSFLKQYIDNASPVGFET